MDLPLVMYEALKKSIIEMFSKDEYIWSRILGTITARHHTVDLKERTRSINQWPYRAGKRSRVVLCEHIENPLEADIIKSTK